MLQAKSSQVYSGASLFTADLCKKAMCMNVHAAVEEKSEEFEPCYAVLVPSSH